jgi:hypothetical protein
MTVSTGHSDDPSHLHQLGNVLRILINPYGHVTYPSSHSTLSNATSRPTTSDSPIIHHVQTSLNLAPSMVSILLALVCVVSLTFQHVPHPKQPNRSTPLSNSLTAAKLQPKQSSNHIFLFSAQTDRIRAFDTSTPPSSTMSVVITV